MKYEKEVNKFVENIKINLLENNNYKEEDKKQLEEIIDYSFDNDLIDLINLKFLELDHEILQEEKNKIVEELLNSKILDDLIKNIDILQINNIKDIIKKIFQYNLDMMI